MRVLIVFLEEMHYLALSLDEPKSWVIIGIVITR